MERVRLDFLSVSAAKRTLGRLLGKLLKTGRLFSARSGHRFVKPSGSVIPEPIPERPFGHFFVDETAAEYARADCLAMPSIDHPDSDYDMKFEVEKIY